MYETDDLLPVDELPGGSVVRVSGPAMVGKHELVIRVLAAGIDRDEACVAVTTDRSAAELYEELGAVASRDLGGAPLGFVEASGTPSESQELGVPVETVGSPTDLTGIGIALSTHLNALAGPDLPARVGLLSLSTLLLYNDPDRVVKFLHVLGQRVSDTNAVALLVVNSEAVGGAVAAQVDSFVDGSIELREQEGRRECRVRGFGEAATDWRPIPEVAPSARPGSPGRGSRAPDPIEPSIERIRELVDRVESEGSTLTVANYTGEESTLQSLDRYFTRLNVDVRTTRLGTDTPTDVAMLHRGDDLQAAAPVPSVASAVDIADDSEMAAFGTETTRLLDAVDRTVFDADGLDRRLLVQASHTIETLARRTGEGRLHAGFQQLSRLTDDPRARRVYDSLADSNVEVHVYGEPDDAVDDDRLVVHTPGTDEVEQTWFLAFVGPDDEAGTLVAIEREEGYHGFWSYRSDLARELDGYLCSRY